MENRPAEEIKGLAADVDALNAADSDAFVGIMTAGATQDYTRSPDASSGRVAERIREMLRIYGDESSTLSDVRDRLVN